MRDVVAPVRAAEDDDFHHPVTAAGAGNAGTGDLSGAQGRVRQGGGGDRGGAFLHGAQPRLQAVDLRVQGRTDLFANQANVIVAEPAAQPGKFLALLEQIGDAPLDVLIGGQANVFSLHPRLVQAEQAGPFGLARP
ncbi:hypothetical protein D3C85_1223550 [compost metagenome]